MFQISDFHSNAKAEQAFRLLVNNYQNKVFRFISLFISNDQECEELVSDVFISLWTNREKLPDVNNLDSYIFIVAKNKALNHLRKDNSQCVNLNTVPLELFHKTETTPESIFIDQEIVDQLNSVIDQLPPKTKLAFHLVREDKMKYKDAAEILGVSIKTIEKQVAAAVAKLKEKLIK